MVEAGRSTCTEGNVAALLPSGVVQVSEVPVEDLYIVLESEGVMVEAVRVLMS